MSTATPVRSITLAELENTQPLQANYLRNLRLRVAKNKNEAVAVYVVADDDIAFINDVSVELEHVGEFAANAPKHLWLTAVAGLVRVRHQDKDYTLAVSDERYKFWKPVGNGWSNITHNTAEGHDLVLAAQRELHEELVVFSLDRKIQYTPAGAPRARLSVPCLGVELITAAETRGMILPLRFNFNTKNRCIELVYEWDLRTLRLVDVAGKPLISIAYDDDWFQGGHFGTSVSVLDEYGVVRGHFAGQQGLVMHGEYSLHPAFQIDTSP